ncbi:MAG: 23S rRNA pseudouridine1911/1915/1917 synthase [Granulosicoccus sp.]|jgi:23S rRNA pseudouridine1911/1915/1917 synthase
MKQLETYSVPTLKETIRLSDLPWDSFSFIQSRKAWKKAIKKGLIKVNGEQGFTGSYISGGEQIDIFQDDSEQVNPEIDLQLEVLFEDDHLAVVNKPAGIEVSGNKKWTLQNALSGNLKSSGQVDWLPYLEPIHRLDYPTSGALLIGKTASATTALNRMFESREIKKTYVAVTIGEMPKSGEVESEIDDKPSRSLYQVLNSLESERFGFLNLVELNPETGRRHQLRKHMLELGNPILGDWAYFKEGLILKGKGLYLHAASLEFEHPNTGELIKIQAPLPGKFQKLFPED